MAQLAKDHKAAEGQLHKMEKKDWSVFVLLAIYILHHIATFCIALQLREYDQYCCVTTVLPWSIAIYVQQRHLKRSGCCAGVRSARTLVRDTQGPVWFLASSYTHYCALLYLVLRFSFTYIACWHFFCSNIAILKLLRDACLFRNARHFSRCQGNQSHERGTSKA